MKKSAIDLFPFLTLVKERPAPELDINEFVCPYCRSYDVVARTRMSTAVGGDDDRNHVQTTCICNACRMDFTQEHIHFNTWYTDSHGHVLAGIPTCFENYLYTCRYCGGTVSRNTIDLDGNPAVSLTSRKTESGWMQEYRYRFKCEECSREVICEQGHYYDREKMLEYNAPGEVKEGADSTVLADGWSLVSQTDIVSVSPEAAEILGIGDEDE